MRRMVEKHIATAFASQLATWRAVEETISRVLSSHSNISERMALLHGGGGGGGGGGGSARGGKLLADGTTIEAADAIPDSEMRLRLSEAHAAELVRLERIMCDLLKDLTTVVDKMDGLVDDAMHTTMPAAAPLGGMGSHRRLGGGGGRGRGGGGSGLEGSSGKEPGRLADDEHSVKHQQAVDVVTRMSDVCGMYSRELWRKEELLHALLAQV